MSPLKVQTNTFTQPLASGHTVSTLKRDVTASAVTFYGVVFIIVVHIPFGQIFWMLLNGAFPGSCPYFVGGEILKSHWYPILFTNLCLQKNTSWQGSSCSNASAAVGNLEVRKTGTFSQQKAHPAPTSKLIKQKKWSWIDNMVRIKWTKSRWMNFTLVEAWRPEATKTKAITDEQNLWGETYLEMPSRRSVWVCCWTMKWRTKCEAFGKKHVLLLERPSIYNNDQ